MSTSKQVRKFKYQPDILTDQEMYNNEIMCIELTKDIM